MQTSRETRMKDDWTSWSTWILYTWQDPQRMTELAEAHEYYTPDRTHKGWLNWLKHMNIIHLTGPTKDDWTGWSTWILYTRQDPQRMTELAEALNIILLTGPTKDDWTGWSTWTHLTAPSSDTDISFQGISFWQKFTNHVTRKLL